MKKIITTMLIGAGAAALSMSASYAAPGGNIPGFTYVTSVVDNPVTTGTFTAALYEAVYRNNTTGNLRFVYQAQNFGTDALETLSGDSYTGFTPVASNDAVDVGAFAFTGGTGPVAGTPRSTLALTGVPNFDFNPLLGANQYSALLVVDTTARFYGSGNISVIDRNTATVHNGFAPTATPEASTMVPFVAVGLGLLGLVAARRKKAYATFA